jgi:hypothetical protein
MAEKSDLFVIVEGVCRVYRERMVDKDRNLPTLTQRLHTLLYSDQGSTERVASSFGLLL